LRILYLADIRFPLERANGIQTIETCYALAERGHDVQLLVRPDSVRPTRDPFAFFGLAPHPRLAIERAAVIGPPTARRALYLTEAVVTVARDRSRTDAVVTRDLGVASLVLGLPRALRPPLIYESHGYAPVVAAALPELVSGAPHAPDSKLRRLSSREERVWRLADGYVTITSGLAAELTDRFGSRPLLATIPDGVRLEPRRAFVAPTHSSSPTVGYGGHLYPWKGVDVLLRALALLPKVRGLIVGGHPAERDLARLRALAETLAIDGRVEFTGFLPRSEVAARLGQTDIVVMPHAGSIVTERYSSPLKLFEYMALGKPIVASDVSAVREVLRDGDNARLVPAGDPEALAAGITQVLADPSFAERIARTAFTEASSYSWDRRGERLESLLATVVTRR
jgi:glycosyltransferase involved in cell wall biosynthesis